ncbi:hypothetical protein [Ferruginibacter sp. SUN106]|uniref:hypothetical protein n=1 Tax=Ferruginibacter sp. SUN106 TaxID=2978348 RepID=UPI003D35FA2F
MQIATVPAIEWTGFKRIIFRFCFLYFAIYIFFTPNNEFPVINDLYEWLNNQLHRFIPWFAKTFFGYKNEITIFTNGSGDTTYDYMLWFFGIVLTVTGTIIWTLLDRKRISYNTLYYWIRVLIRYYLFCTMISYGLFKVIKLQFPFPYLGRLVQPYGDSSPMGLAWTYMGYSNSYNYFTGYAELLAGVLLLFRRTSTIGALVALGVMTNVFMINIGYDVPVKLLSFNTILMSLFLLWKDLKRLVNFFILNRVTLAADIALPYSNKKLRYSLLALKWIMVVLFIWINFTGALDAQKLYGEKAPKPPLYGIYYTETFTRNNDTLPPLDTDTSRWERIIIQRENYAAIRLNNDTTRNYNFKIDTVTKTATVFPAWDTINKIHFNYLKDSVYLTLSGAIKNDSVYIKLKRFDENKFRLVNRGFHWVNEFPFNR